VEVILKRSEKDLENFVPTRKSFIIFTFRLIMLYRKRWVGWDMLYASGKW